MAQKFPKKLPTPRPDKTRGGFVCQIRAEGKRHTFRGKTKAECDGNMRLWFEGVAPSRLNNATVGEVMELYLDYYRGLYKPTSAATTSCRLRSHLALLSSYKLNSLNKIHWQAIVTKAANGRRTTRGSIALLISTIKNFCKWAAANGYIEDNQVPIYFNNPIRNKPTQKGILQPDEMRQLFSPEENDMPLIDVFRFLVLTGLRRGELIALKRERDFDGTIITIRESISTEHFVTSGKTNQANRSIRLTNGALACVEAHQTKHGIGDYLFSLDDSYVPATRLRGAWNRYREKHRLTITIHELRHTFISYSRLKTTEDITALKQLYGHSASMNTDSVYVHDILKTPEELEKETTEQQRICDAIDSVFSAVISKGEK